MTLGPLSFRLLQLPILHDFAVFFTLLLTKWTAPKMGMASLVGVVGSIIVILAGAPLVVAAFAASAILFDVLTSLNRHRFDGGAVNVVLVVLATMLSAYFAGVVIGVLFMNGGLEWALTVWGSWHLAGGTMTLAATLPILGALERAKVRKVGTAG